MGEGRSISLCRKFLFDPLPVIKPMWLRSQMGRSNTFHCFMSFLRYQNFLQVCSALQLHRILLIDRIGSIKLKSYAGRSLLSGLLSAPAARKRAGVVEILDSFPYSKFILIGDSGEQDLELYAEYVSRSIFLSH